MIALLAMPGSQEWIPMADDSQKIGDQEIEELLEQAQGGASTPEPTPTGGEAQANATSAGKSDEADSQRIGDQEIEELLKQAQGAAAPASSKPTPTPSGAAAQSETTSASQGSAAAVLDAQPQPPKQPVSGGLSSAGDDIQFLLQQAEEAIASIDNPAQHDLETFQFTDYTEAAPSREKATLDLLRDVELDLRIELGRTEMYLEDVLKLRSGAVVALDKMAGDPVDVYVNGRLVARGEVLVMNDNFCVRVAELITGDDTE
jgi:flagellar motor switch protein FliN/FliY